jgi:hypothetical protein
MRDRCSDDYMTITEDTNVRKLKEMRIWHSTRESAEPGLHGRGVSSIWLGSIAVRLHGHGRSLYVSLLDLN